MKKAEKIKYLNMPVIGVIALSVYDGISIKGIEYGIDDYVIYLHPRTSTIYRRKIHYENRPYFYHLRRKVYFDNIMRA